MAYFDGFPAKVAFFDHPPTKIYEYYGKRALDLTLSILLLPFLIPAIAIICALVRRDGGPGLYAHTRIGRNGRAFRCWKIRSMVPDADARLACYLKGNADAAREWARTQKLARDPRITRLGSFLRRTSLDELPQIWNVLRGEMSLVGPRPVTQAELTRYGADRFVYLSLRPGVTGLWQIMGRSNGCYDERLRLDLTYAASLGLLPDLGLILRTALVVIRPTGR